MAYYVTYPFWTWHDPTKEEKLIGNKILKNWKVINIYQKQPRKKSPSKYTLQPAIQ